MFRPLDPDTADLGIVSGLAALGRRRVVAFEPATRPWTTHGDRVVSAAADPVSAEWRAGFAAGYGEASQSFEQADAASAASSMIELSFARAASEQATELSMQLRDAVVALCGSVIDLAAIEPDALNRRIDVATALLQRADDDRLVRLHPDDLALVESRLVPGTRTLADQSLERGTVRIDTPAGGIEDGPAGWRRAIEAAVGGC
jgi:flagellar assembly protein FliH